MTPVDWLTLVLAIIACGLGTGALALTLRSTPHALQRKVDDVFAIATRAEQRSDQAVAAGDATREHVAGVLEELEETYQRVERKRKRAETAATRAEEAAAAPAAEADSFDAALSRARAAGYRV